jgi:hypothetical protein
MAFIIRTLHKSSRRFIGPSVAGAQGTAGSVSGLWPLQIERLGMPLLDAPTQADISGFEAAGPGPDAGARIPAPEKDFISGVNGAVGAYALENGITLFVPPFLPIHVDVDKAAASMGRAASPGDGYPEAMDIFSQYMLRTVFQNIPAFAILPRHTIEFDSRRVMFGSPLKTGKYESIPVYLDDESGQKRLVLAYRSGSQGCWRRFAGVISGIFWKGESEHLQNFDYRIQMKLDAIYDSTFAQSVLGPDGNPLSLEDLGISAEGVCRGDNDLYANSVALIAGSERVLQGAMLHQQKEFDVSAEGNKPGQLITFWWAGNAEDPYGKHVNLMVLSRNMKYLYCLALTDDGLFPKYIQGAESDGINSAGAPSSGVPILKESLWLLTPIVEYDSLCSKVKDEETLEADIHGTVIGGGNRVRILGVHENSKSPFFELNNGMHDYYRLLRSESFGLLDSKLRRVLDNGGVLPQSPVPKAETAVPREYIEERLHELLEAYHLYAAGALEPGVDGSRDAIARLNITGRDLALFKRYFAYVEFWRIANGGEAPLFAKQTLVRRLERVAERFTHDMEGGTIQDSGIISRGSA